jgi:hypothetical protein
MSKFSIGCDCDDCIKNNDCELYYINLSKEVNKSFYNKGAWETIGFSLVWVNSPTNDNYKCGQFNNYKMFKPYKESTKELTLCEIKNICKEYRQFGCDKCKLYDFCKNQLGDIQPSDWQFDKD